MSFFEATTELLTSLADVEATEAVEELVPRVSEWPAAEGAAVNLVQLDTIEGE